MLADGLPSVAPQAHGCFLSSGDFRVSSRKDDLRTRCFVPAQSSIGSQQTALNLRALIRGFGELAYVPGRGDSGYQ